MNSTDSGSACDELQNHTFVRLLLIEQIVLTTMMGKCRIIEKRFIYRC